jgi:CrcB protein
VTIALFALAAAGGALGRHLVQQVVHSWQALLIVNIVGSGVLGLVVGADLATSTTTVLGAGFCGALTTYSGFTLETLRLPRRWSIPYVAVMLAAAYAAATLTSQLFA